jgi:CRP/FNR family nitrogen fixation transcriptional regulator
VAGEWVEKMSETATRSGQCSDGIDKKEPSSLDIAIDRTAFRKRFKSNEEIYGANERANYFYKVVSGCVRCYTVLEDGRRLIASFYLPGEIFGLEPTERHLFSAEAVSDAETLVINRNEGASERVVTFLLEMDDRLELSDENGLPMCRQDIADYLALSSETVSRKLSKLESASAIALRTTRHIVLRDRAVLELMVT